MAEPPTRHSPDHAHGSQALADSLKLQRSAQKRVSAGASGRGRRRRGDVINLDERTVSRSRRRRFFFAILFFEALIAAFAVGVFVVYLTTGRVEF